MCPLPRPPLRLHGHNPHVSIFVFGHPHTTSSCRPGDCQHFPWKSRESPLFRSFLVLAHHRDYSQDRVRRNGLVRRSGSRDSNGSRSLSLPPESEVLASTTLVPRVISPLRAVLVGRCKTFQHAPFVVRRECVWFVFVVFVFVASSYSFVFVVFVRL